MPAFDGIRNDEQIAAVPAYIRSRWPADIRERQARINEQTRDR
jgi:mono/diheme cytochrome c family protein